MTCVGLMPLSFLPNQVDREGRVGPYAYFVGIGLGTDGVGTGQHFADGRVYTNFPGSVARQDRSKTFQGTYKPNNFDKGFGVRYKKCA